MVMTAQSSSAPYNPQTLNLPSISALVSFYHACLGFLVKKHGWMPSKLETVTPLMVSHTHSNEARYCPNTNKTILENLAQQCQNVWSTKPKLPTPSALPALPTTAPSPVNVPSNQVFITVYPLSRPYMDDTGHFPVKTHSGNQYIMIAFHTDGNLILQQVSKHSRQKVTAIALPPTMPLWHAWQPGVFWLTSRCSTMMPAQNTKKPSPSSRMPNSNLSNQMCIAKTGLNALFARSRTTSWQYWPVSTPHLPRSYGIFFCHRLNSPLTFSIKPCSIQGLAHGNFSKGSLTST
jgi:hypothetical protein